MDRWNTLRAICPHCGKKRHQRTIRTHLKKARLSVPNQTAQVEDVYEEEEPAEVDVAMCEDHGLSDEEDIGDPQPVLLGRPKVNQPASENPEVSKDNGDCNGALIRWPYWDSIERPLSKLSLMAMGLASQVRWSLPNEYMPRHFESLSMVLPSRSDMVTRRGFESWINSYRTTVNRIELCEEECVQFVGPFVDLATCPSCQTARYDDKGNARNVIFVCLGV